ncbi:MAG: hypothetical protein H7289_00525 [Mucilaginibacter sp.]|nr:hypothetical protein [Mucilaginibacter sp.]
MAKRILIILILLVTTGAIYAQQYTSKNLLGRWESTRNKASNIVFLTDSTGAFLASDGFIYNRMNYSAKVNKDIVEFKYTVDPTRKHPRYAHPQIKFLNDSIFLFRMMWGIPKNADTSNKKVAVYKRIKELPGTEMRIPNSKDILGVWGSKFKDTTKFQKFTFADKNTVYIQTSTQGIHKLRYTIDFTQQPITLDIYDGNRVMKQGFIGFYGKDVIRVEFFEKDKRGDHFTVFGGNAFLYRDKKTDASLYQQ